MVADDRGGRPANRQTAQDAATHAPAGDRRIDPALIRIDLLP